MKKILISLGALTTLTGTVIGVASCGTEKRIETLPVKTGVAFSINGEDITMDEVFSEWAVTDSGMQSITEQMLDNLTFEVFKRGTIKNPDGTEWTNNDKTARDIFEEIEKEVDTKIEEEINLRKKAYRWDWDGKMQMDLYDKHGGSKETYKKYLMVHWSENGGAYNLKQLLLDSLWATAAKSEEEIKNTTIRKSEALDLDKGATNEHMIRLSGLKDELFSPFQKYIADNFESIYKGNIKRVSALLIKYASDEYSTKKGTNLYLAEKNKNTKINIIGSSDGQYSFINASPVQLINIDEDYFKANPAFYVERDYKLEPFNRTTNDYSKSSYEKFEDLVNGLRDFKEIINKDFEQTNLRDLTEDSGVFNNIVYADAHWGTRFKEAVLTRGIKGCGLSSKEPEDFIHLFEEGQIKDGSGGWKDHTSWNKLTTNHCYVYMGGGNQILVSRNSFGYHFMKVTNYNINELLTEYVAGVKSDTGFGTKVNIFNELKSWSTNKYLPSWSANYWLASYLWNSTNITKTTKELFGIDYNPWFNQLTGANASIKDEFSKLYTVGSTGTNITNFTDIQTEIDKMTEREVWNLNKKQSDKQESFDKEQEDARKNYEWEKLAEMVNKTIDITTNPFKIKP